MRSQQSRWARKPIPAVRIAAGGALCAFLMGTLPSFAQGVTYQPSQRTRTGMETCMKDEVSEGAFCIKKCAANFRLDAQKRPPVCIATSAAAKVPASTVPEWVPPPAPKEKKAGA